MLGHVRTLSCLALTPNISQLLPSQTKRPDSVQQTLLKVVWNISGKHRPKLLRTWAHTTICGISSAGVLMWRGDQRLVGILSVSHWKSENQCLEFCQGVPTWAYIYDVWTYICIYVWVIINEYASNDGPLVFCWHFLVCPLFISTRWFLKSYISLLVSLQIQLSNFSPFQFSYLYH